MEWQMSDFSSKTSNGGSKIAKCLEGLGAHLLFLFLTFFSPRQYNKNCRDFSFSGIPVDPDQIFCILREAKNPFLASFFLSSCSILFRYHGKKRDKLRKLGRHFKKRENKFHFSWKCEFFFSFNYSLFIIFIFSSISWYSVKKTNPKKYFSVGKKQNFFFAKMTSVRQKYLRLL